MMTLLFGVLASRAADTRVCGVTLSYAPEDRTLVHVLAMLDQAAARQAEIVCLPQECVPTDGGAAARAALEAIAAKAAARHLYIVVNLREKEGDRIYLTSYLIDARGRVTGKYRKSHRMPDETIALGDDLPVFDTPFGKVGLMVGTDHYWPEIPLVLAMKGAVLILWSNGVEPVPQGHPLEMKMRTRAMDDHATMVGAQYAGALPYLSSNYPRINGEPLGCSSVVDRSGRVLAEAGHHPGAAVAAVDLQRSQDIFYLTYKSDPRLFSALSDPNLKPLRFRGAKRQLTVSIAQVTTNHGPSADPKSPFAMILDQAGRRGSDIIVMSEFGVMPDTPAGRAILELVAGKARQYQSYIYIAGINDPELPYASSHRASWGYLWDRTGKVVARYRIVAYGASVELPVYQADFGVVGLMVCGDIFTQEVARALALQGAEIILYSSQAWGPSGQVHLEMECTRALDNRVYLVAAHFPQSEASQRSSIIDPYGQPLARAEYWRDSVATADVDLDAEHVWFARSKQPGGAGKSGYMAGYYPEFQPEQRSDLRTVLFAQRRPELYEAITSQSLASRDMPAAVEAKMNAPKKL